MESVSNRITFSHLWRCHVKSRQGKSQYPCRIAGVGHAMQRTLKSKMSMRMSRLQTWRDDDDDDDEDDDDDDAGVDGDGGGSGSGDGDGEDGEGI